MRCAPRLILRNFFSKRLNTLELADSFLKSLCYSIGVKLYVNVLFGKYVAKNQIVPSG